MADRGLARWMMAALTGVVLLVVVSTADAEIPKDKQKLIIRLANSAGVLSSTSCQESEKANEAVRKILYILRELQEARYIDFGTEKRLRSSAIVPRIKRARQSSHTSSDCSGARRFVDGVEY